MRFIHTADIHLDSPLKGLEAHDDAPVDTLRIATRRAFDNLIDLAVEEHVDFLLIAGDLYDGDWKDYNTGLFFAGRMGRLARAGIRVFIVSGNHDAASRITRAMPLPDNVHLFQSIRPRSILLENLGAAIHGQSYAGRAVTENLAAHYPAREAGWFNIGLLHTSLTGREGHENYAPCRVDDLTAKDYDYWALGHVHQREIIGRDPWILFPGNLQGRHIRETGAKGATLVTVADGRVTEIEHRPLDVLRWADCLVDLTGCESAGAVHEQTRWAMEKELEKAEGKTLALRLHLAGSCLLHADLHARAAQWTEEFRGLAESCGDIWLEKVKCRTSRLTTVEELAAENTSLSGLLRAADLLGFDGRYLAELVPDLAGLKIKLPPELLDADCLLECRPEQLHELRQDIRELLIAKLIQQRQP
jgi:DNA repair protein SbcD/Mre11